MPNINEENITPEMEVYKKLQTEAYIAACLNPELREGLKAERRTSPKRHMKQIDTSKITNTDNVLPKDINREDINCPPEVGKQRQLNSPITEQMREYWRAAKNVSRGKIEKNQVKSTPELQAYWAELKRKYIKKKYMEKQQLTDVTLILAELDRLKKHPIMKSYFRLKNNLYKARRKTKPSPTIK